MKATYEKFALYGRDQKPDVMLNEETKKRLAGLSGIKNKSLNEKYYSVVYSDGTTDIFYDSDFKNIKELREYLQKKGIKPDSIDVLGTDRNRKDESVNEKLKNKTNQKEKETDKKDTRTIYGIYKDGKLEKLVGIKKEQIEELAKYILKEHSYPVSGYNVAKLVAEIKEELDEAKNTQAKTRKVDEPYEIWKSPDKSWEWRVLKKWQADDDKPQARWFCAVKSPMTYGTWDYGDCYVKDIKKYAVKVAGDTLETRGKGLKRTDGTVDYGADESVNETQYQEITKDIKGNFKVSLKVVPNIDYDYHPDRPESYMKESKWANAKSLSDARRQVRAFIEETEAGGGNWTGGEVVDKDTGKTIAKISYNGRIWKP